MTPPKSNKQGDNVRLFIERVPIPTPVKISRQRRFVYSALSSIKNVDVNILKIALSCFADRNYFLKAGAKIETYF